MDGKKDFAEADRVTPKKSPALLVGGVLFSLLGGLFLLGGFVLLAGFLLGRGPARVERFTIIFDLVVGSVFLCIGILLTRLATRKDTHIATSSGLVLKNDRQHQGAGMMASAMFALVGVVCFCGLVAANVRDPQAVWAGANVKSPRVVYIFLEVLTFVWTLAMAAYAVFTGRKFFDRSVKLIIDETGLYDRRSNGKEIRWSHVADVKVATQHHRRIVIAAGLNVVMKDGSTVVIDIYGLDHDHQRILEVAEKMLSRRRGKK